MALGSNCTGNDPLPILSAVLVAGACGARARAKFQGGPLASLAAPWGREAEPWALSLGAGRVEAKEVAFLGKLGGS